VPAAPLARSDTSSTVTASAATPARPLTSSTTPAPPPPEWAKGLDATALKIACKERGLTSKGTRRQLLERLARFEAAKAEKEIADKEIADAPPGGRLAATPEILDLCDDGEALAPVESKPCAAAVPELAPLPGPKSQRGGAGAQAPGNKTLEPRCPSPPQIRQKKTFQDSGPLPKAMTGGRRDAGFGGLVVHGRKFRAQLQLPGVLGEDEADHDEFLMDNILEETGAAFAGTSLLHEDQLRRSSAHSARMPAAPAPSPWTTGASAVTSARNAGDSTGMSVASATTAGAVVGLGGASGCLADQLALMEEEHWMLEEELEQLASIGLGGAESVEEQQALLSSLQDGRRDLEPDEEVAVLLQSLQQSGCDKLNACIDNDLSLSVCSLQSIEAC